jgi:lipopolysaccharide export system protein LptA
VESASVSSATAGYDGSVLMLKGQVRLDHGLGTMNADEASLERQESGKDFPFSLIHLNRGVLLHLKNRAQMRCDAADLDFTALRGVLRAEADNKVSYSDRQRPHAPLELTSRSVDLEIAKTGYDGRRTDYDVESILAIEDVTVEYADAFTLRADRALYQKEDAAGVVTAYPHAEDAYCHITHGTDTARADRVRLDLRTGELLLTRPDGRLTSSLSSHLQEGDVSFSADTLLWNHRTGTLALDGNARIQERSLGTVTADERIELVQSKDSRTLQSIRAHGLTRLVYQDASNQQTHSILSHGTIWIDRAKLCGIIESPEGEEEKQLYYEREEAGIYADQAVLEYALDGVLFQPVSLSLKGHVRLFARGEEAPHRCGLADRLTYSPSTHTLIMSADPGRKVLFWDEEQGLRISAHEVHITQDPVTHKDTIRGVGNVKLAFTADEANLLKHFFPLYEILHDAQ